jgi:hypothetical protein
MAGGSDVRLRWCETSGYFVILVDADDLTDKSGEEEGKEDPKVPGFTLLPLLTAIGLAMLFS